MIRHDPRLRRRRAGRIDDDPAGSDPAITDGLEQVGAFGVVADDAGDFCLRAERLEIEGDVGRATGYGAAAGLANGLPVSRTTITGASGLIRVALPKM